MGDYYDYAGVIHVHSTFSDGLWPIQDIIKAANQSSCSYLVLTDHNNLKALAKEGVYGNTLFLVGEEVTVGNEEGHYLALSLTSEMPRGESAQTIINCVARQGGFGFIAHPFKMSNRNIRNIFRATSIQWQDWNVSGINGLEIWNYTQDWTKNFDGFHSYLPGLLFPDYFIVGPSNEVLKKWDELLISDKVVGIGSVDAHGYFYPYYRMFRTIRNHVLLKEALTFNMSNFKQDKQLVYEALRRGNCYFSYDYLENAEGFTFLANNGKNEVVMGDDISLRGRVILSIKTPYQALIRLVKNGQVIEEKYNSKTLTTVVREHGVYRVEVYLKKRKGTHIIHRPWIYSNPIYIKK